MKSINKNVKSQTSSSSRGRVARQQEGYSEIELKYYIDDIFGYSDEEEYPSSDNYFMYNDIVYDMSNRV